MNYLSSKEIREKFLKFFESKGHTILPSTSLVPADPTILLTIAGMVPFKPIFLGRNKSSLKRVTTCQKCIRTTDLENVGRTARHHTFFEMLGNFSFGDYFKKEAIQWSWEFFTEVIGFPEEKLWVSIYQEDEEAYEIWHKIVGLPEGKIIRLGEEDNFWKVGPTGPCGPCSEIYIDLGEEKASKEGGGVGVDNERYLELWNLVFMQYNRNENGLLTPLPQKNIDTGLGLERMASVLQKADTDFETDLFLPIIDFVAKNAGIKYREDGKKDLALKVIADHTRALVFMIADGIMPSNEGRGYVLRMLLRRAFRYGRWLNFNQPFLYEVAPVVVNLMKEVYPELAKAENQICQIILTEEKKFQETLNAGIQILESMKDGLKRQKENILSGKEAFKLYDTYGFPIELTKDLLKEDGLGVDETDFEREMKIQRERSRKIWAEVKMNSERDKDKKALYEKIVQDYGETEFVGYEEEMVKSKVLAIIKEGKLVEKAQKGDKCAIILDKTPFYAEKGGQIGDQGKITSPHNNLLITVSDTQSPVEGLVMHLGQIVEGEIEKNEEVIAGIETARRRSIARNHTATHLLHRALREVLGNHVKQAGSWVADTHLRFDFHHFAPLTKEEIDKVEELVNSKILKNLKVETTITTFAQARESGAIALFGEKYGEYVRVVKIGEYSLELCGGTHLESTAPIGLFKILGQEGIGSGIRRVEAVTGEYTLKYLKEREETIETIAGKLRVAPSEITVKLDQILEELSYLKREIKIVQEKLTRYEVEEIISKTKRIKGINILSAEVEAGDNEDLRNWGDLIKEKIKSGIILLGTKRGKNKVALLAIVTDDLIKQGFDATKIIQSLAPLIEGQGGGNKKMAQAGGRKVDKLKEALEKIYESV